MKRRDFIFILVSAVILSIAWIVFTIIHQSVTSTISEAVNQQINPIKPTFDTKTVEAIKKRDQVNPMYTFQSQSASSSSLSTPILITPTPFIPTPTLPIAVQSTPIQSGSAQQASGGAVTR